MICSNPWTSRPTVLTKQQVTDLSSTLAAVADGDHVTGSDAPPTLIEYGDFGLSRPVKSRRNRFELPLSGDTFQTAVRSGSRGELSESPRSAGFWEAHSLLLTGRQRFSQEDLLSRRGGSS